MLVPSLGGHQERGGPVDCAGRLDIRAALEEQLNTARVARLAGLAQRCQTVRPRSIHVSSMLEQRRDARIVTLVRRREERCAAVA